jgi:hypothetical protein
LKIAASRVKLYEGARWFPAVHSSPAKLFMASVLNPATLRSSPTQEVVKHLESLLRDSSEEQVTQQLIQYIDIGLITPTVFQSWLRISPSSIHQALRQEVSVEVRRLAIIQLRKGLRSSRWQLIWESVGGVQGLVGLFSHFSVLEVKEACRAIGTCARGIERGQKRELVTQLFMALQPRFFPTTDESTQDSRTLSNHYQRLLPACSSDLVSKAIEKRLEGMGEIQYDIRYRLPQFHPDTLQTAALRSIFDDNPAGSEWLSLLLHEQPSETATPRGFSASMMFSLDVLQRLSTESNSLSTDVVMDTIIRPLLKRAVKKKADWFTTRQIVDLMVEYIKRHPNASEKFNYKPHGLLHFVGVCWAHRPDLFELQFELLLRRCRDTKEKTSFRLFEDFYHGVPKSRRYALLRFCFQVATGRDTDIENDLKGAEYYLTYTLLNGMSAEKALGLFDRLRSAQGGSFVGLSHADNVLKYGPTPDSHSGDPDLWHTVLLQKCGRQEEAEGIATKLMRSRMKKATSSSTPDNRVFYVKSAFGFAIASGSLELYKEAHEWAQRFTRDPRVVKELYQRYPDDAKKLLSGIPERISKDTTLAEIQQRIHLSNWILASLFDRACSALREPSFTIYNWHGTLCLFLHAVRQRIDGSVDLKNVLGTSDEDIYDALWRDTLTMLIQVEVKALAPGHERLNADSLGGILHYRQETPTRLQKGLPSTYRFFDDLARARDELWRKYRPTVHPAALSIPEPFPRGLPIQHLTGPFILDSPSLETVAPYVASCRDAVVFPDPSVAQLPIPSDAEIQAAIGVFVDDYKFGLELLLPTMLGKEEKTNRLERSWAHAIGVLSQGRMNSGEAVRYWQTTPAYKDLLMSKTTQKGWPLLPEFNPSDRTAQVEEWNPLPEDGEEIKARTLGTVTYMDISKSMSIRSKSDVHSTMAYSPPTVPGVAQTGVWSWDHINRAKGQPTIREGQIVSALLYLDTFTNAKTRILARPFPSSVNHIRYPALYLDGQFLSKADRKKDAARAALKAHITTVPAPLLAHVARDAMKMLDSKDADADGYVEVEKLAFELVELLGQSDKPALASDLAVRIIIQRPDASSWYVLIQIFCSLTDSSLRHRLLLSPGHFRRLSANNAQACIKSLADAILAKVEQQAETKGAGFGATADTRTSQSHAEHGDKDLRPFVKVTTVKFLAQLLDNTEFVSEDFAVSVLQQLLEKATHIDIRSQVVKSLLKMYSAASQLSAGQILVVLEAIVPLAGNIRERRPITDLEWDQAEKKLELPEMDPTSTLRSGLAPVLESLLDFVQSWGSSALTLASRGAFIKRVMMPVVDSLTKQTRRWVCVCIFYTFASTTLFVSLDEDGFGTWEILTDSENSGVCLSAQARI